MDQATSIDSVIAIGAVATAVFTGILAFIGWHQKVGGIVAEWEFNNSGGKESPFQISVTVRNSKPFAVDAWKAEAWGVPIFDVRSSLKETKHESWPDNVSPIGARDIEPNSYKRSTFFVFVDWASLSSEISKRWFFRSSAKLKIRIEVYSKVDSKRHTRITTSIKIPAAIIEKNVANAAQK